MHTQIEIDSIKAKSPKIMHKYIHKLKLKINDDDLQQILLNETWP